MDTLNPRHPDFGKLKFVRSFHSSMMFNGGALFGALLLFLTIRYNLWPVYVVFLGGFGVAGVDFLMMMYRYYLSLNGETKYL